MVPRQFPIQLSDRARAFLAHTTKDQHIGMSNGEAIAQLEMFGCPPKDWFIQYLTLFAGIRLDSGQPHYKRSISLSRIERESQLEYRDRKWSLWIAVDWPSGSGYILDEDGTIRYYRADDWQAPYVSCFEIFWEDKALQAASAATGRIVDRVAVPKTDAVAKLANSMNLPPIAAATDEFVRWWQQDSLLLGVWQTPDGAGLTASWPESDVELDQCMTAQITSLIPRAAEFRASEHFRMYRKTGDAKFIREFDARRAK
jgi:hypothetical protein